MRLDDERPSHNIEDRRGAGGARGPFRFPRFPGGRGGFGGRRVRLPMGRRSGGFGIGTIVLLLGLAWLMGINPLSLIFGGGGGGLPMPSPTREVATGPGVPGNPAGSQRNDAEKMFVAKVLGTTERTWDRIFRQRLGREYVKPKLVLFSGQVSSACGFASAAMGPFYCPLDSKVYLDFSFFRDMQRKLGASGDFAQAYVIAHEVGHHIQNLLGILSEVQRRKPRVGRVAANQLQVRVELQADCLAGVWGAANRHLLERGDLEEALRLAAAIGDDRLQKRSRGYVVPDSFTHGSAEQRVRWFRRGFETGDIRQCDTFRARQL